MARSTSAPFVVVAMLVLVVVAVVALLPSVVDGRRALDGFRGRPKPTIYNKPAPIRQAHRGSSRARGAPPADLAQQVLSNMDFSVDPCQDFYQYACGSWLQSFELPADRARYSLSSDGIADANEQVLLDILQDESGSWPLVGPFYDSCMDQATIDARGLAPLNAMVARLGAPSNDPTTVLAQVGGVLHRYGIPGLFAMFVAVDSLHPEAMQVQLDQGGLGLYTPSDYTDSDVVNQYLTYMSSMFQLAGDSQSTAQSNARLVLSVESALANASYSNVERRDPYLLIHPYNVSTLASTFGGSSKAWNAYLVAVGLPPISDARWVGDQFNVNVPPFFHAIFDTVLKMPAQTIYTYLRWCIINDLSQLLPSSFVQESFEFYGAFLNGQEEITPRWRTCVQATDENLGELLGRYFVADKFPAASKSLAQELVKEVELAFLSNLPGVDWMDNKTRALSAQKLSMVDNLIGYPAHWTDYTSLCLVKSEYFESTLATRNLTVTNMLQQMFKPVDKEKWEMTPPTVNAYYQPTMNEFVLPAGILQAPFFFSLDYPVAMNLGGAGNVVGHELVHGFDDEGSQYDGSGKLHEWWPPSVREAFDQRAQCVSELYSSFEVLPGVYINGNLTNGENIADIGGMHSTYTAYQQWIKKNGPEPVAVPPLTNEQLFFVTYALTWCEVDTPEYIRQMVQSNPHSPAIARVNVPLSQLPQFAQTFKCAPNTPMNPSTRCNIW